MAAGGREVIGNDRRKQGEDVLRTASLPIREPMRDHKYCLPGERLFKKQQLHFAV